MPLRTRSNVLFCGAENVTTVNGWSSSRFRFLPSILGRVCATQMRANAWTSRSDFCERGPDESGKGDWQTPDRRRRDKSRRQSAHELPPSSLQSTWPGHTVSQISCETASECAEQWRFVASGPGFHPHLPGFKYKFLSTTLGATMWFFIFYRMRFVIHLVHCFTNTHYFTGKTVLSSLYVYFIPLSIHQS